MVQLATPLAGRPTLSIIGAFQGYTRNTMLEQGQAKGQASIKAVVAGASEMDDIVEGGGWGEHGEEHAGTGSAAFWWEAIVHCTRARCTAWCERW